MYSESDLHETIGELLRNIDEMRDRKEGLAR
jgi:hypothetical protein